MARYTEIKIIYEGKNISRDIAPYIINFSYTDNSGDKSDDINLTLHDRDSQWLNDWFPTKGDKLTCSVIVHDWFSDNTVQELPCGEYEVDEISYKAPPRTMEIKAKSIKVKTKAINEKHNHSWENTELKTICSDIAGSNNLELFWDCEDSDNIQIERRDQIEKSDIEYVKELCRAYDLSVKVNDGKLIIFSEKKYQERDAIDNINADSSQVISWSFNSKSAQTYKGAHVRYHHAVKDETFEVYEEDDSIEGSEQELEINERVESIDEAKRTAKKRLSEANSKEITGSITLFGNVNYLAGVNVNITGFGMFDGKYMIESAVHKITGGYNTTINLKMGSEEKKQVKTRKKYKQTKKKANVSGSPQPEIDYSGMKFYGE